MAVNGKVFVVAVAEVWVPRWGADYEIRNTDYRHCQPMNGAWARPPKMRQQENSQYLKKEGTRRKWEMVESMFSSNQFRPFCLFTCLWLSISRWLWCQGGLGWRRLPGRCQEIVSFQLNWVTTTTNTRSERVRAAEWCVGGVTKANFPSAYYQPIVHRPLRVSHFLLGARSSFYQILVFNNFYLNWGTTQFSWVLLLDPCLHKKKCKSCELIPANPRRKIFCSLKWEGCPMPVTRFCIWYLQQRPFQNILFFC